MKPKLLLRLGAIIMILHLAGHTFGHLGWRKCTEPVREEVVRHMTEYKFPFMGAIHSIGDYYEGYGWTGGVALFFFAAIMWSLSAASVSESSIVRRQTIILTLCLLVWGVLEWIFFFPFAAAFTLAAAVCCGWAYRVTSNSASTALR